MRCACCERLLAKSKTSRKLDKRSGTDLPDGAELIRSSGENLLFGKMEREDYYSLQRNYAACRLCNKVSCARCLSLDEVCNLCADSLNDQ